MKEICKHCNTEYKSVGTHWGHSPEHQPKLTKKQYDILLGFLMSDGSIGKRSRNSPRYIIELSNKEAIYWLGNILSNQYINISKNERSVGKNSWRLTFSHHQFKDFVSWYNDGEKKYPKIKLTPWIMSAWYAGDGGLNNPNSGRKEVQCRIRCMNEMKDWSTVNSILSTLPMDVSPTYTKRGNISFGWEDTIEMLNYMPVVGGYEYKWTL